MSRSRRKHPIAGWTTCASERDDKRRAHHAERQSIRRRLRIAPESDWPLPHWYEFANPWLWGKDGKMRFSPQASYARKLMRK
jgi:hypothetical protein